MIVDTLGTDTQEFQLSDSYQDGFAWAIVYEVDEGVVEFSNTGLFTTVQQAFLRMEEMRKSGEWSELFLVAVKAFNPCGIDAE